MSKNLQKRENEVNNFEEVSEVDFPYPAQNPFPQTQELTSSEWDKFYSSGVDQRNQQSTNWTAPLIPSTIYCLNNRLENLSSAITSCLFYLDLTLEEYPNRNPSNLIHQGLKTDLEHNVNKIRNIHKQVMRSDREIRKILNINSYFK